MSVMRTLLLKASQSPWLREQIPQFQFSRRAVARFMPGEHVEEALKACQEFQTEDIGTLLTYLGENVHDAEEARQVSQHYCDVLSRIERLRVTCELSVKPTQLGRDMRTEVKTNLQRIIEAAQAARNFVWIDMEDSNYTDATLDLYRELRPQYANVGLCLQSYLYRTAADLESLLPLSPAIRLVKGAYREPPDRAFPRKPDVDSNFMQLAEVLMDAIGRNQARVGFATHDQRLVERIQKRAAEKQVPKTAYEFQMLYGIRTAAMRSLVGAGYRGRVLISYGPAWFAWYMRRLAERPANLLFVVKNVFS
jgi:proline dehydrogenase